MNFDLYSKIYDIIYSDKNYNDEVTYIHDILKKYQSKTILDLGCGTGIHSHKLSKLGYDVLCVDKSINMLKQAINHKNKNKYIQGNITNIRISKKFDSIISLFHVLNYLEDYQKLLLTFNTVKIHLKKGGIFIFDVWFTPAVEYLKPQVKVKRFEDDHLKITRITEPIENIHKKKVEVKFEFLLKIKSLKILKHFKKIM